MSSDWNDSVLSDVIDFNPKEELKKGKTAKKIAMEELHPFDKKVNGFTLAEYSGGAKFRNGDTLLARITPCLENGKTAYVDILEKDEIAFGSTEFIVMRAKTGITDEAFIYYLATSPAFRAVAIQSMTGTSGRQRVQNNLLENAVFRIPTLPEQRAIAATLSALDDKIELNNRINKTLEEMAQALFKQWFVDFEFPDENGQPYKSSGGEMEESELGPIPKGWKLARLSDICNVLSGGTPKTGVAEYWNGPIPFFSPKDASDGFYTIDTEKTITGEGLKNCNSKLYPKDTVFITARGTVGKVVLSGRDMAMNQSCYALQGREEIGQYFLFFQTVRAAEQLRKSASGAVFDAIIVKSFDSIKVVVPPTCFLESFCELVHSLLSNVCLNTEQNNYLSSLRDAILPQLMSGEIRVPIEEVAADV